MKKLEIIIKSEKLESLKKILEGCQASGIMITNIMGYGNQKGYTQMYRGTTYVVNLLPKVKVETVVPEEMAEQIEQIMTEQKIGDQVELDVNAQFVRLTLSGALLFDSAQSQIREDALPLVDKLSLILEKYNSNLIDIEGHTDNVPIHNDKYESNDLLSAYRAFAVKDYILGKSALDAGKIYATGCGEYNPVADNSTPEGRARNRRVEIKIYNSYNSN